MAESLPTSSELLSTTLEADPTAILLPTPALHQANITLLKQLLDPLVAVFNQQNRDASARTSRKRKRDADKSYNGKERLGPIHVENLVTPQIWEQARAIIDAGGQHVQQQLEMLASHSTSNEPTEANQEQDDSEKDVDALPADDETEHSIDGESDLHMDGNGEEEPFDHDFEEPNDRPATTRPDQKFKKDKFGLNDGFFSIDDFNRESEALERQDFSGDRLAAGEFGGPDVEIDYDADPFVTAPIPAPKRSSKREKDDDESSGSEAMSSDEDMDAGMEDEDLDSEDTLDDDILATGAQMLDLANTNDIMFEDFFGAPKHISRTNSHLSASAFADKLNPTDLDAPESIQRTIEGVHRDLFEDQDDSEPDESEDEGLNAGLNGQPRPSLKNQSTYERQKAKLSKQIQRLEAENISDKPWVLSGEARATIRPLNSLLEQDLDFERTGKPVPLITAEVSESIEALIKRRIIAGEFDEVKRRQPDTSNPDTRRGIFELSDVKPQQGLADMYEEDYRAKADPETYLSKIDEATKNEHEEISKLWHDLSASLDALSNFHYRPKPAALTINVVSNVPTISMEDARPSGTAGENGSANVLAPQELASKDIQTSEVATKGGLPLAREELTRDQKLRRRRREKERMKKSQSRKSEKMVTSGKAAQREQIVGDLRKGNVQVIGKRGELSNVDGKRTKANGASHNSASYKL